MVGPNEDAAVPGRLLWDQGLDGAWNMAVDQALLDSVLLTGQPVLRFYQWREPTVSLGYFQPRQDRFRHPPSVDCPWLRRATGGGAIVHDRELTYSLAVPPPLVPHPATRLYEIVHCIVMDCIRETGLPAALHPDPPGSKAEGPGEANRKMSAELPNDGLGGPIAETGVRTDGPVDPAAFLCFQRRSPGDLVAWPTDAAGRGRGCKILGSAQRKSGGAVLQHGSCLLAASAHAPELPGLNDLLSADRAWQLEALAARLQSGLATALGWHFFADQLSDHERRLAEQHRQRRFASRDWNEAR